MEEEPPAEKNKINRTQAAFSHFEFLRETEDKKKKYKCLHCGLERDGTKPSNLASHLKTHSDVYSKLHNSADSIERKRLKLLLDCVQLVTVDGRAFANIYDSAVLCMNERILCELRDAGRELNLRDPHLTEVKERLKEVAKIAREKISSEVKNRAISLLVDIVTKRGRSILGVSIQYILDGKHKVRSIGMIELNDSHTGIYLAEVIKNRLNELSIDLRQVITITTDNGANVLKMVRDMEEHLNHAIDEAKNAIDRTNETSVDREIEELLALTGSESDEEAIQMILERDYDEPTEEVLQEHENLLTAITTSLKNAYGIEVVWDVKGINCAAHTLQLAIMDCLKITLVSIRNLVTLCRKVAIFMRLDSTKYQMDRLMIQYKKPRLDVKTRWGSLYLMVSAIFFIFEISMF